MIIRHDMVLDRYPAAVLKDCHRSWSGGDPSGEGQRLDFGVADETAWEVGLSCGGQISVLVLPVADTGCLLLCCRRLQA